MSLATIASRYSVGRFRKIQDACLQYLKTIGRTSEQCSQIFVYNLTVLYLGPRRFLSPRSDETRERKKRRAKTSGCRRCESHYHATMVSRESSKQPITTHLSVNTSQSEYAYKVPPIRRQGQILTLVQIYWRGKINQLSRATRGFLTSLSISLSSLLAALLLSSPLAPRVAVL